MQGYQFRIPGATNKLADIFSHSPTKMPPADESLSIYYCTLVHSHKAAAIMQRANTGPSYQAIKKAVASNKSINHLPPENPCRKPQHVWDNLSISEDGQIIVDSRQLYVLIQSRQDVMKCIHCSHCELAKSIVTAKASYHWLSLTDDLKIMIENVKSAKH